MCSFLHFSLTCFDILSWNFADDLVLMYYRSVWVLSFCVNFWRSYATFYTSRLKDGTYYGMVMSVRVSVRLSVRSPSVHPSVRPSGSPSARFPHFSPTCFDISSWNFAHDFVLMYYRSSLSVITLRQFLKELCLFVNLEYRKCAVFCTFLLHALSYWAEILPHDFVLMYFRASLSVVPLRQFLKELCLFWNWWYRNYTVFRSFFLHALTYWAEILHMLLF